MNSVNAEWDRLFNRINSLEAERNELIADRERWATQAEERVKDCNELRQQLNALSAQVEGMRVAIAALTSEESYETEYDGRMESYCISCGAHEPPRGGIKHYAGCGWVQGKEVLELTPATALALHDAEVLERLRTRLSELIDGFTSPDRKRYWLEVVEDIQIESCRLRAGGEG